MESLVMHEAEAANAAFPAERLARVSLLLRDGRWLHGSEMIPRWDHRSPPTEQDLRAKCHVLADPVLGPDRADAMNPRCTTCPDAICLRWTNCSICRSERK